MRRLALVHVLSSLALVASLSGSARASFPGANGPLVFTASSSGQFDVYSVEPDSTGLRQIINDPQPQFAAASSPGGGRIAFAEDTGETCGHLYYAQGDDLFLTNADGTGLRRLTDNCPVADYGPSWSPSGRRLVFARDQNIWTMHADGSDQVALTCQYSDSAPVWSPDGRRIAFVRDGRIAVMNPDGSNVAFVTAGAATSSSPSFSPDRTRIAFVGDDGVSVVNLDGSGGHRVVSRRALGVAWSLDGLELAFVAANAFGQRNAIHVVNVDGSGEREIYVADTIASLDWAQAGSRRGADEPEVTPADTACLENPAPPAPPPSPVPGPARAADVALPNRLVVGGAAFEPRVLRSRRPFTLRLSVREASGLPVQGAVVAVDSVPAGRVGRQVQRVTDPTGSAVFRLRPTAHLPIGPGGRLVLAVRARKPGEPWTGGVAALRLVSVRTGARLQARGL